MPSAEARHPQAGLPRRWLRWAVLPAALAALAQAGAQEPPPQARPQLSQQQVAPQEVGKAVAELRQQLAPGTPTKQHVLRFKPHEAEPDKPRQEKPEPERQPSRMDGRWLDNLVRYGVWLLGFALVAFVLLRLHRWVREHADGMFTRTPPLPPSHVQSLDVRPESLPASVGAAAAALWREGKPRAALALLYRGALSRLIHGYGVPVRGASTEGECLALAAGRLDAPRQELFARLVAAWQQTVYAARLPAADVVLALCQDFDRLLAAPVATTAHAPAAQPVPVAAP